MPIYDTPTYNKLPAEQQTVVRNYVRHLHPPHAKGDTHYLENWCERVAKDEALLPKILAGEADSALYDHLNMREKKAVMFIAGVNIASDGLREDYPSLLIAERDRIVTTPRLLAEAKRTYDSMVPPERPPGLRA